MVIVTSFKLENNLMMFKINDPYSGISDSFHYNAYKNITIMKFSKRKFLRIICE